MAVYDLVILGLFAAAVLFGLWKGLAWQVASLAAIAVSYFVALRFSELVASWIPVEPPWNRFAAMLGIFLATSLVIWIAFGYVRATIERWRLKDFDRQAGAVMGALKGALLCIVVTMFAVTLLGEQVRAAVVQSWSGNFICRVINQWSAAVPRELHDVLTPVLQRFNERFQEPVPANLQTDRLWEWSAKPQLNTQPLPPRETDQRGLGEEQVQDRRIHQALESMHRFGQAIWGDSLSTSSENR
ncbi:MAG TPA: CvpA family protein [Pirellulaceae bacterium]|nr:CvpA family protein [Pirellulaceae bacterium]